MKVSLIFRSVALAAALTAYAGAQDTSTRDPLRPSPAPSPATKLSQLLAVRLESFGPGYSAPREKREQAYAKLMEGQRLLWTASRSRSQTSVLNVTRIARQAFKEAADLDPKLSEAYTALAELSINTPPGDIDEGIALAALAVRVNSENFGGHRILARLYTYRSGLPEPKLDSVNAPKAMAEWQRLAELDPRNAEAWAFLSEIYARLGMSKERVEALRKWISASPPVDMQFYRRLMGPKESLTAESGTLKLARALLDTGEKTEAIGVISELVSDDPENAEATQLLSEIVRKAAGTPESAAAIEALKQAVYANPSNQSLLVLLADVEVGAGHIDDAAEILRNGARAVEASDAPTASELMLSLGQLYVDNRRLDEAIAAFESALKLRGIDASATSVQGSDREFAMRAFEKLIKALASSNKIEASKNVIERARKVFGDKDLFADRQLISLYRGRGMKADALAAVKSAHVRFPDEYEFIRQEATLLTENGRVDEAVALMRNSLKAGKIADQTPSTSVQESDGVVRATITKPVRDDFSTVLFIASLYSYADRSKEAIAASVEALAIAGTDERRQIAKVSLATAQQMGKQYAAAEKTLREILATTPDNPIALNNLGYFLTERGERYPEAIILINKALAIDPNNPSFLDSLGWVQFKSGDVDNALTNLSRAAELDPTSSTILDHLGDVYLKKGRKDDAKSIFTKALTFAVEPSEISRIKLKLK